MNVQDLNINEWKAFPGEELSYNSFQENRYPVWFKNLAEQMLKGSDIGRKYPFLNTYHYIAPKKVEDRNMDVVFSSSEKDTFDAEYPSRGPSFESKRMLEIAAAKLGLACGKAVEISMAKSDRAVQQQAALFKALTNMMEYFGAKTIAEAEEKVGKFMREHLNSFESKPNLPGSETLETKTFLTNMASFIGLLAEARLWIAPLPTHQQEAAKALIELTKKYAEVLDCARGMDDQGCRDIAHFHSELAELVAKNPKVTAFVMESVGAVFMAIEDLEKEESSEGTLLSPSEETRDEVRHEISEMVGKGIDYVRTTSQSYHLGYNLDDSDQTGFSVSYQRSDSDEGTSTVSSNEESNNETPTTSSPDTWEEGIDNVAHHYDY